MSALCYSILIAFPEWLLTQRPPVRHTARGLEGTVDRALSACVARPCRIKTLETLTMAHLQTPPFLRTPPALHQPPMVVQPRTPTRRLPPKAIMPHPAGPTTLSKCVAVGCLALRGGACCRLHVSLRTAAQRHRRVDHGWDLPRRPRTRLPLAEATSTRPPTTPPPPTSLLCPRLPPPPRPSSRPWPPASPRTRPPEPRERRSPPTPRKRAPRRRCWRLSGSTLPLLTCASSPSRS